MLAAFSAFSSLVAGFVVPPIADFASPGPTLLDVGPLAIRWYGLLIAIAVSIGLNLSQFLAPYRQLDPDTVGDFAIWCIVGAIVGARLYYVAFEWDSYADDWLRALQIWRGGIAIHGAILGGTIVAIIFARKHRFSVWKLLDVVAPSLVLGQAIGRWGNFFNSEAFGAPTDLPWKLYIPAASRPLGYANYEYFHPTFLYESLWNLGVFALICWLFWRGVRGAIAIAPGTIFLVYFGAYSLGRLWIEGLRMDSLMLGPLRMAQAVSLGGMAFAAVGLYWLYGLRRSLPDTAETASASRRS